MPKRMVSRKTAVVAMVTLLTGGLAMSQRSDVSPSVMRDLRAERWQVRRDAFESLPHLPAVARDSQLNILMIQLRATEDKASEAASVDLFEDDDYLAYDQELTERVEQIAVSTNRKDAWRSLVYMRYNGDSATGKWLAGHRQSLPFLLGQARSPRPVRRMTAVYVVALLAARSRAEKSLTIHQYQAIRRLVRNLAINDALPVRDAAIQALGVLGDRNDLSLLDQLEANDKDQYVRKFASASAKIIRDKTHP